MKVGRLTLIPFKGDVIRDVPSLEPSLALIGTGLRVADRKAEGMLRVKSFDSRTYSINDFVEWDGQGQLELNPTFQRRSVWSEKAKSYLMDTIVRGKPIPKFFIRQRINVSTKTSIRDIVDGQQRLRTILSYINDGFVISKGQNAEFGGKRFSQLDEEVQAGILPYEIAVGLLINLPDPEILDIFSRLNSYAVILNEQEKLNAQYFGPFKIAADSIGRKYTEFWTRNAILTAKELLRMGEVNLVADLLIAMIEGLRAKKRIKAAYKTYEGRFDHNMDDLSQKFDEVMVVVGRLFPPLSKEQSSAGRSCSTPCSLQFITASMACPA